MTVRFGGCGCDPFQPPDEGRLLTLLLLGVATAKSRCRDAAVSFSKEALEAFLLLLFDKLPLR